MPKRILKLGTRGSSLALAQASLVAKKLEQNSDVKVEIVSIVTTGDNRSSEVRLASWDKKDWIAELESALLNKQIDFAVHSAKDVPYQIEPGTSLVSVLERESPYDICIFKDPRHKSLADLPSAARIGTSSLRRAAQIASYRRDLKILPIRGNVPTRIRKLSEGVEFDAIVLAQAGVNRLALEIESFEVLEERLMLPAVNQGILAVQYLSEDRELSSILKLLTDPLTEVMFVAERSFIQTIEANCNSAVSVLCKVEKGGKFTLASRVYSVDYSKIIAGSLEFDSNEANKMGGELGKKLLDQGAKSLLS